MRLWGPITFKLPHWDGGGRALKGKGADASKETALNNSLGRTSGQRDNRVRGSSDNNAVVLGQILTHAKLVVYLPKGPGSLLNRDLGQPTSIIQLE